VFNTPLTRPILLALFLFVTAATSAVAQPVNPYARLTDPLALARLDNPDFGPLSGTWGFGTWSIPDQAYPDYRIAAQDTGAGILAHLFSTYRIPDSLVSYKLIVDGKPFRTAYGNDFFASPAGMLHGPLDTLLCEARLCDVQIPYHHGFRLLYKSTYWAFQAYQWRPLNGLTSLPDAILSNAALSDQQAAADSIYLDPSKLWKGFTVRDTQFKAQVLPHNARTLCYIERSAIANRLHLLPERSGASFDSIWLDIHWDGEARPSFSAPLSALFCHDTSLAQFHSLPIEFSRDSGFTMRLPMPFAVSMRVAIRNISSFPIIVAGAVSYHPQKVDRNQYGYLHAVFSESQPATFHLSHPVFHVKGRGRYFGLFQAIPRMNDIGTMEGNPQFMADSTRPFTLQYEGTEDYFNGAQYYSNGNFQSPFGGGTNTGKWAYRFHYLDCYDFRSSFDFDFQHGPDNDARECYRTLGFFYLQHQPFWTDRDTVRPNELWTIAGSGYSPHERITVMLDSFWIGLLEASSSGTFDHIFSVPQIAEGYYHLTINGASYHQLVFVSHRSTVRLERHPSDKLYQTGDTIYFTGTGFAQSDSITGTIDAVPLFLRCSVDSLHQASGWFIAPKIPDGHYPVVIDGKETGTIKSETISVTRTLRFECEHLWNTRSSDSTTSRVLPLWWGYSQHNVMTFRPNSTSRDVQLHFVLPISDTFTLAFEYAQGRVFGDYDLILDSELVGSFVGFLDTIQLADTLPVTTRFFEAGPHTIQFHYRGYEGQDSLLWADLLLLTPTTTILPTADTQPAPQPDTAYSFQLFPNPASSALHLTVPASWLNVSTFSISDDLGRAIISGSLSGPQTDREIPIAELSSGSYHLQIAGPTGTAARWFRVIK